MTLLRSRSGSSSRGPVSSVCFPCHLPGNVGRWRPRGDRLSADPHLTAHFFSSQVNPQAVPPPGPPGRRGRSPAWPWGGNESVHFLSSKKRPGRLLPSQAPSPACGDPAAWPRKAGLSLVSWSCCSIRCGSWWPQPCFWSSNLWFSGQTAWPTRGGSGSVGLRQSPAPAGPEGHLCGPWLRQGLSPGPLFPGPD